MNSSSELQSKFSTFHENIKLLNTDDNQVLRDKRDILVKAIQKYLKENHLPTCNVINQGSYAMGTGIKPKEGETYDIDIALEFNISQTTYSAILVKSWIESALSKVTTRTIKKKKPCIRVEYSKGYDVDIACFATYNGSYLATGTNYANSEWKPSDPRGVLKLVNNVSEGQQFKRVIRYLKRWRDAKFTYKGYSRPSGIALTACALKWFSASKYSNEYRDIDALLNLVKQMINSFGYFDLTTFKYKNRLKIQLQTPPQNDLFEKMTDIQMQSFYNKLVSLKDNLQCAKNASNTAEACKYLRKEFGSDFPK